MAIYQGNKKISNNYSIDASVYSLPIGSIIPFGGAILPTGFLLCDGQAISKTKYIELYKVVGDLYGESGSEDTFLLPDLRDRFVQGANGNLGNYVEEGLPDINGELGYFAANNAGTWYQGLNTYSGAFSSSEPEVSIEPAKPVVQAATSSVNDGAAAVAKFKASNSNSIYGSSEHVQPKSCVLNFIIKATKINDQYSDAVGALIDDTAADVIDKTWSAKRIRNSTIPYVSMDTTKNIDLNDYTETGYYTPNISFSTGKFTHEILNAPTDGWLPAGGFALEVKSFDNNDVNWYTQILFEYVSGDECIPIYVRTFFYKNAESGNVYTPWRRIADINDSRVSENEVWSSKKINDMLSMLPFKWELIGTSSPETGEGTSNTFSQTMSGGNPFCVYHSSGVFCFGNGVPANRGKLYGMTSGQVASVTYTSAGLLTVNTGSGVAYIYQMKTIG